jgi:acyl-CoA carboxylase subunit beta
MAHAYPVLATRIDRRTDAYKANLEANNASLVKLTQALAKASAGGGEKYNARFRDAGKLLPRERIERLLDRDSYFLELCPLAGFGKVTPGAGVVGGIGLISGRECLITASEATVKGGSISEWGLKKSLRIGQIGVQNHLPSVSLIESAGADLPNQSEIFVPGGASFRGITQRSKSQMPSVCVVFGSSTAGGAYIPGMSDYTVMVKEQAAVYLAGPPLVKMATGEESDHEELGGADMHSRVSGVSDYLAQDEVDGLRLARMIVSQLAPPPPVDVAAQVDEPLYSADELLGIASHDIKVPFEAREVIARIVDGSRFAEFKPLYGGTLVCGFARIHGFPVGILANNGILFSESANKGAQFIALCNQADTPLLFLQNTTGFMVGKQYEEGGIIKAGAKLINAVSNSTVPAITIMTGGSFGAGNYAMSGRSYEPRFLFTWPNHRIGVMGGKQLAGVLDIIKRDAAAKKGVEVDEMGLQGQKMMVEAMMDQQSDPYFATARMWDDGIIDPRDTRSVIGISLSACFNRPVKGTNAWGVFRH